MKKGDRVFKTRGYPFPGIIVASFLTLAGERRYVVESTILPGMLHIFNKTQLSPEMSTIMKVVGNKKGQKT